MNNGMSLGAADGVLLLVVDVAETGVSRGALVGVIFVILGAGDVRIVIMIGV